MTRAKAVLLALLGLAGTVHAVAGVVRRDTSQILTGGFVVLFAIALAFASDQVRGGGRLPIMLISAGTFVVVATLTFVAAGSSTGEINRLFAVVGAVAVLSMGAYSVWRLISSQTDTGSTD